MNDRRDRPVDLLADLDAGLLDPAAAAEVRAAAARDPRAAAVLDGLAATRADLAALADPPVPARLAQRWDAALVAEGPAPGVTSAEGSSAGPVGPDDGEPPAARRPGRRRHPRRPVPRQLDPRRLRHHPALAAAAVLAAAVVGGVLGAPREPAPPSLTDVDLATAGLAVRGDFDVGALADPARRTGCLQAVAPPGVAPDAPLLGGRDVVLDGRPGVLLLLATGRLGHLQVVVVDPGCGPGGGTLLGAQTIGG